MKKIYTFSIIVFISIMLILGGCGNKKPENIDPQDFDEILKDLEPELAEEPDDTYKNSDINPIDENGYVVNPSEDFIRAYYSSREGTVVAAAFDLIALAEIKQRPVEDLIEDVIIHPSVHYSFTTDYNKPANSIGYFHETTREAVETIYLTDSEDKNLQIKGERLGLIIPIKTKFANFNFPNDGRDEIQLVEAEGLIKTTDNYGKELYYKLRINCVVHMPEDGGEYKLGRLFEVQSVEMIDPLETPKKEINNLLASFYALYYAL